MRRALAEFPRALQPSQARKAQVTVALGIPTSLPVGWSQRNSDAKMMGKVMSGGTWGHDPEANFVLFQA